MLHLPLNNVSASYSASLQPQILWSLSLRYHQGEELKLCSVQEGNYNSSKRLKF